MATEFQDDRFVWWSFLSTISQINDLPPTHPEIPTLLSKAEQQLAKKYAGLASASFDSSSTPSADLGTDFASAEEFHVVTRLLELRAQYSSSLSPSPVPLVLPSLLRSDTSRTPEQALLAHFASPVGEKWSASNLGFELWNRETALKYGTVEGREWAGLWERLSGQLEKGCAVFFPSLLLENRLVLTRSVTSSDVNWHTMLYLIRAAFSCAAGSSISYFAPSSLSSTTPSTAGLELITRSRERFLSLAKDSPKAKVERGFLLGSLEIAREVRERGWDEGAFLAFLPSFRTEANSHFASLSGFPRFARQAVLRPLCEQDVLFRRSLPLPRRSFLVGNFCTRPAAGSGGRDTRSEGASDLPSHIIDADPSFPADFRRRNSLRKRVEDCTLAWRRSDGGGREEGR
jgi:hypothetical protein